MRCSGAPRRLLGDATNAYTCAQGRCRRARGKRASGGGAATGTLSGSGAFGALFGRRCGFVSFDSGRGLSGSEFDSYRT